MVLSGFEIGLLVPFPAESIERDFAYAERHPVAEAYRAYEKMPYDRPSWDLTSVLYAVYPERGFLRTFTARQDRAGRCREDGVHAGKRRELPLSDTDPGAGRR